MVNGDGGAKLPPLSSRWRHMRMSRWPRTAADLIEVQHALGQAAPTPWQHPADPLHVGACFVCFDKHSAGSDREVEGELGWAAAAVVSGRRVVAVAAASSPVVAPYVPALLALREGPLLDGAVRALPVPPDVLIVNATGWDHPRRAGWPCTLVPSWGCRPSVRPTGRLRPRAPGPQTTGVRLRRCCWTANWWVTGSGPVRAPGRWLSMPRGGPPPMTPSRSSWRPLGGPAPHSHCAAPAKRRAWHAPPVGTGPSGGVAAVFPVGGRPEIPTAPDMERAASFATCGADRTGRQRHISAWATTDGRALLRSR